MLHWNLSLVLTANKKQLQLEGLMRLHVLVGDLKVAVQFGVVNGFAVHTLVQTPFIKRYVRSIFPTVQETTLWNFRPIHISVIGGKS